MRPIKYFYLFIGVIIFILTGFDKSVNTFLENLKSSLMMYSQMHPEEKVYLQFDKPFYKPGEDIWFNVFLVDGSTHQPSAISDVVYVELKDPKGSTVQRLDLFASEGTTKGDFSLSETSPGGIYTIVGYTRWMKNAGEACFFTKQIQVQKVITPRMLLKLDFEKEAYGPAGEVIADLSVKNLKNENIKNVVVRSTIKIGGQLLTTVESFTNEEGKTKIKFLLPRDLDTTDGLLQALVSFNGQEESISRAVPIVLNRITLQFFPEGGDLVAGAASNVAFKAANEFGKGADVSGEIVDEKNNVITTFESFHMGMGAFRFTPELNRTYKARVTKPAAIETTYLLPSIHSMGYTLALKRQTSNTIISTVHASAKGEVFLVAQSHGVIYYADKIAVIKGRNTIPVDVSNFPAGISMFTLFNSEGLEEAERLIFINEEKTLRVSISTDKKAYLPKEKVELKIHTSDEKGEPVPARLSLAVADDQLISFADDKQDNILSWLLLSSEVKGKIQEPSFYFDEQEPKAKEALDYLLMTHGWRRFTWKEILKNDKAIVYVPENNSSISGSTTDQRNNPDQAEVILLELGNRRRIAKVKTTSQGQFIFKNIDATIPLLLLTRAPHQLQMIPEIKEGIPGFSNPALFNKEIVRAEVIGDATIVNKNETPVIVPQGGMDLTMNEDVAQLSEVIVIGYGTAEREKITGALVTVRSENIDYIPAYTSLENILEGRVAGVQVEQQNANPGAAGVVHVRGLSSLAGGRGEPLYVIDGQPISGNLNRNFSNGSILGPEDISSISILHSPEASAIFGSSAANGATLINTKSNISYSGVHHKRKKARYSSLLITPRKFSVAKEFYTGLTKKNSQERNNFNTTVYWNPDILTNKDGNASLTFLNNDAASAFRITAEGISATGLIGRTEQTFATELPFSLDTKIPDFLGFEDTLRLPVMIKNTTPESLRGNLSVTLPDGLRSLDGKQVAIQVEANTTKTHWIRIISSGIEGKFPIAIQLQSNRYNDEIKHSVSVHPIGFPVRISMSGKELEKTMKFTVEDLEKGSLKGEVTVFTDVLTDLFTGAESILAEPHGCFEQVSSSTFPNILALHFLNQSGQLRPDIEKKALAYIKDGYKKLAAYEINGGGFEWFGNPPAHEALTAYGLLEFYEMKKVYADVDQEMIDRTRKWLWSRRTGKGTFKQREGRFDSFSHPAENIGNTYLVYALSETGTTDITDEYNHALADSWNTTDMYTMALMANVAYSLNKMNDYKDLIKYFTQQTTAPGFDKFKVSHSVVWSQGMSLINETVSLWALALMKSPDADLTLVNKCIQFILSRRSYGMFGSTQATVLSLKALTEYARYVRLTREGEVTVAVNNIVTDSKVYPKDNREKIILTKFNQSLKEGTQTVSVNFKNTTEPLPYTVNIKWSTKTPASNQNCKVKLSTALAAKTIKVNETLRLSAVLQNTTHEGVPMTIALIGIPAGLSLQPWQLKELQEKKVFDFYEILGDRLAIYYRELEPHANRAINLDLKAEVPGGFTGAASTAYLYYTDENKFWVKGNKVSIIP